jgi:hypothetical protein
MGGMKEKMTGSGCAVAAVAIVVAILMLPPLYVLSSGPALLVTHKARLPGTYWNVAYRPLTFARDTAPGFDSRFQWYLDLWTK